MTNLIFATNNINKVKEIRSLLTEKFNFLTLLEAGINVDIPEPYETIEKNAREKAEVIYKLSGLDCFAEDTGLKIAALNGDPGVRSARYAGEERSCEKNIDKVLFKLKNEKNRSGIFKTIICLIINGRQVIFDGICKGTIIAERRGDTGFGYDPIFIPEGSEKTFAEMTIGEKNKFSHRRKAIEKLIQHLNGKEI